MGCQHSSRVRQDLDDIGKPASFGRTSPDASEIMGGQPIAHISDCQVELGEAVLTGVARLICLHDEGATTHLVHHMRGRHPLRLMSVDRFSNGLARKGQSVWDQDTGQRLLDNGSSTIVQEDCTTAIGTASGSPPSQEEQIRIYVCGVFSNVLHGRQRSTMPRMIRQMIRLIADGERDQQTMAATVSVDETLKIVWSSRAWTALVGVETDFWKCVQLTTADGEETRTTLLAKVRERGGMDLVLESVGQSPGLEAVSLVVHLQPLFYDCDNLGLQCRVHAIRVPAPPEPQVDDVPNTPALRPTSARSSFDVFASLTLGQLLGKGGYGSVYRGILEGQVVAIKVIDGQELFCSVPDLVHSSKTQNNQEIDVGTRLDHRNVVKTLTHATRTIEGREQTWIVLEYCEMGSLRQLLEDNHFRNRPDRIQSVAKAVATGMTYLHARQILHGDLSGNNVLFDRQYTAKVSDFGLSRDFAGATVITSALGTTSYMAPELLQDGKLNKKSDVYSFGILLFEMLTGKRAFSGMRYVDVINQKLAQDEQEILRVLPADAPADLTNLVLACLQSDYNKRPTFDEIVALL